MLAAASLPPTAHRDDASECRKRCSALLTCVGVTLFSRPKREREGTIARVPSHVLSLTAQTVVHLATLPPHVRPLHCWWHDLRRHGGSGCETRECKATRYRRENRFHRVELKCPAHHHSHQSWLHVPLSLVPCGQSLPPVRSTALRIWCSNLFKKLLHPHTTIFLRSLSLRDISTSSPPNAGIVYRTAAVQTVVALR